MCTNFIVSYYYYYYYYYYSFWWTLASSKIALQCPVSCDLLHQFLTPVFFQPSSCWVVRFLNSTKQFMKWGYQPHDNPQPGEPWYAFVSGSSRLTCLAWKALPVKTLPPDHLTTEAQAIRKSRDNMYTVILRLTKTIRSGITFVSRNLR